VKYHVAGLKDAQKGEATIRADLAGRLAVDDPRRQGGGAELITARPAEEASERLGAVPVDCAFKV